MKIYNLLTKFICPIVFTMASGTGQAQSYKATEVEKKPDFQWPEGKQMGLSLTFDDARLSQADKGIPLLDRYNVKATFYLSPDNMMQRPEVWKKALANSHDIGNHSLHHPCSGNFSTIIQNITV